MVFEKDCFLKMVGAWFFRGGLRRGSLSACSSWAGLEVYYTPTITNSVGAISHYSVSISLGAASWRPSELCERACELRIP